MKDNLNCEKCNGIMEKKIHETNGGLIFLSIVLMVGLGFVIFNMFYTYYIENIADTVFIHMLQLLTFISFLLYCILFVILIISNKVQKVWECVSCGYFFNRGK